MYIVKRVTVWWCSKIPWPAEQSMRRYMLCYAQVPMRCILFHLWDIMKRSDTNYLLKDLKLYHRIQLFFGNSSEPSQKMFSKRKSTNLISVNAWWGCARTACLFDLNAPQRHNGQSKWTKYSKSLMLWKRSVTNCSVELQARYDQANTLAQRAI